MTFKVGDTVHLKGFGARTFKVSEGPYRTIDCPGVDQYLVKDGIGSVRSGWEGDLMTPEDFRASLASEE